MKSLFRFLGILLGLLCQLCITAAAILWVYFHKDAAPSAPSDPTDVTARLTHWLDDLTRPSAKSAATLPGASSPLNQVLSKPLPTPLSPEVLAQSHAWYDEVFKRHSEMALPEKQLTETENGLLQFLNFEDRAAGYRSLGLTRQLEQSATGLAPYQPAAAQKWAETNRAWLDAILVVGSYTDQSINGVAAHRRRATTEHSEFVCRCASALLLKARVAAEANDGATALTCVRAAQALASHFDRLEAPSFFEYSLGSWIRLNTEKCALTILIPQLARTKKVDYSQWETVFSGPINRPANLSRCYVGEWQITLQTAYLPAFVANRSLAPSLPFDNLVAGYTAIMNRYVSMTESSADWSTWWAKVSNAEQPATDTTPEMLEFTTLVEANLAAAHKIWLRSVLRHSQYQAAFKQLQQEGTPGSNLQPIVPDPLTGTPWVWNPGNRTFLTPNDPKLVEFAIEPLKLP